MKRNVITSSLIVAIVALTPLAATQAAHPFAVDQASEGNPFGGYGIDVQTDDTIGQEFTPTFSALDVVEIGLGPHDRNSLGVKVNIRVASVDGPIIDTSLLATTPPLPVLPPYYHFDFASRVPLVPGNLYVIQPFLVQPSAPVAFAFLDPGPYVGGRPIIHGVVRNDIDMVFRTGLTVPEPPAFVHVAGAVAGILAAAQRCARHQSDLRRRTTSR